jgi:hypothetical protein
MPPRSRQSALLCSEMSLVTGTVSAWSYVQRMAGRLLARGIGRDVRSTDPSRLACSGGARALALVRFLLRLERLSMPPSRPEACR